ncbi:glycoside hydrolase family 16 protein [Corynebacterium hansenii]|uniref:Glycoside hydrolase family 16 protein n=1 Tax=Corynebacterium hansenii TaxID=394964 RepID=A0ABV7ZQW3_9CORY|nr:glycoside hydrolase family 16 protein [Corynebacterium hansenii]WJZ00755.1 Glycosyl hydrolases family 16 [Corynebacterium hansenii]
MTDMDRRRALPRRGFLGALALFGVAGVISAQPAGCTPSPGSGGDGAPGSGAAAAGAAIGPPPPGWREVFRDEFGGESLGSHWEAFNGKPSSDPHVRWVSSMAKVENGSLVLSGAPAYGGWATGAVSGWRMPRTHGLYEIRMRAIPHRVLSYHVLLWPADDNWPPEIDLAEGYRADRSRTDAFLHWRDAGGERRKRGYQVRVDATKPATWAIEWLPGSVRLLVDGVEFARADGDPVPDRPMWFGMQIEARATVEGTGAPADNGVTRHTGAPLPQYTVPVLEVDWIRISEPAGAVPPPPSTAPPA